MTDSSASLLIAPSRLHELLGDARGRFTVEALASCASTNTLLLERAASGAASVSVIVVDRQSAGRGSRGRSWLAAPESSLTFSLLWRFAGGIARLSGLSLAVGVAVVHALEACGAEGVRLKWPNDILYSNAKLGGILVEVQGTGESTPAVIGIGLNLSLSELAHDADGFALPAAALDRIVSPLPERHRLLAQLLSELAHVFDRFAYGGFAELRAQWQALHAWQDCPVRLLRNGEVINEGLCRGADADGALLVQTASGIERCLSGDVSLRAL